MDDLNNYVERFMLLNLCLAQAIRKELFKDVRLKSDVISAEELIYTQMEAIIEAVCGRIEGEPEELINSKWRESMSFIETVTERF